MVEEMLVDDSVEGGLRDYKFFCFHGEPKVVQVDIDRHGFHRRNLYDPDWNRLPFSILFPPFEGRVARPDPLQEMIRLARELSEGFVFARVDFYALGEAVYFGEITLHPGAG